MMFFWIAAIVVFLIIEAATANLVTVWFAVGSAAALLAERLGAQIWLQALVFIAVSVGVLLTLRPFTRKYVNGSKHPTNADRVLGTVCPVTEEIDNIRGTGSVSVDGKVWSARTRDGANIEKGTLVRPVSIEGVKLIVERA
ncbi:MAG: NfeD family protein [Oscillospiraceae bacterium]|nr:NfeD family protein [Oscillospiraceae bacterium]MBQ2158019.1 NfeD family protein [Oscillospiraceae bacterium]MBQ3951810.1 NfeD family protein [Oscillospiraceae bacterium]MBQ3986264.1 NfeD family protein [Oscillospiraceae bacterium]